MTLPNSGQEHNEKVEQHFYHEMIRGEVPSESNHLGFTVIVMVILMISSAIIGFGLWFFGLPVIK